MDMEKNSENADKSKTNFHLESSNEVFKEKSKLIKEPELKEGNEINVVVKKIKDKDKSKENESPYIKKLKKAIEEEIDKPREFYFTGVLDNVQMPLSVKSLGKIKLPLPSKQIKLQLIVKGLGRIWFPLSSEQGVALKAKCTAAPFDRGNENLLHKSVKNAYQVNPEDVKLNDEFNNLIKEKMAEIVSHFLGKSNTDNLKQSLKDNYELKLNKLVYYDVGGQFVSHKDTEKLGMLATLVIHLPAFHKGGTLEVRRNGQTKIFNSENNCMEKIFFTAYFADCEHQLEKITAGHRLVLIYDIIQKIPCLTLHPDNDIKLIYNENFMTVIKQSIEEWKYDNKGPLYLTLKLNENYSDTDMILFLDLKGKDKKLVDSFLSYADIGLYLAKITKMETCSGYPDNSYGYESYDIICDVISDDEPDDRERSYTLSNWIDVEEDLKPYGIRTLNSNEMLTEEKYMFDKDDIRYKDYIEYQSNSYCTTEYKCEKTFLVFCPKSHEILIACDSNISSVIVDCKNLLESSINYDGALETFKGIMMYIVRRHDKAMLQLCKEENVARIFEIISLFRNKIKFLASTFLPFQFRNGNDILSINKLMSLFENSFECLANTFLRELVKPYGIFRKEKVGIPTTNSAIALANVIDKWGWDFLGISVLQLVKECDISHSLGCTQLVYSLLSLELVGQANLIVEVATSHIINVTNPIRTDYFALWAGLLASYDFSSPCFNEIVQKIFKMRDSLMIEIISEMYRSLQPIVLNQYKIILFFKKCLQILQTNGWIKLSFKSIIHICPVVLYVENLDDEFSPLHSFVQSIISHESSMNFLELLLKLPMVIDQKDNPSIQIMVEKRLEQLNSLSPPVFSWAQPNATLLNRTASFKGSYSRPKIEDLHKFLRSDVQIRSFGGFNDMRDATQFGAKYFYNGNYNEAGGYSARHEISRRGKTIKCAIIKTRDYFEVRLKKYDLFIKEARTLKKIYCQPKKTLSKKRTLEI